MGKPGWQPQVPRGAQGAEGDVTGKEERAAPTRRGKSPAQRAFEPWVGRLLRLATCSQPLGSRTKSSLQALPARSCCDSAGAALAPPALLSAARFVPG